MTEIINKTSCGFSEDELYLLVRKKHYQVESLKAGRTNAHLVTFPIKLARMQFTLSESAFAHELSPFSGPLPTIEEITNFIDDRRHQSGWDLMSLARMPMPPPAKLKRVRAEKHFESIVPLRRLKDFQGYLKNLSQNARHNWSVRERTSQKQGLRKESNFQLSELFDLYKRRSAHRPDEYGTSLQFQKFLIELCEQWPQDRLVKAGIYDQERLVGASLGFIRQEILYVYQVAHDPDLTYRKSSPGHLALTMLIEEGFKRGLEEVNFMAGNRYHKTLTPDAVEYWRWIVGSGSWRGRLWWFLTRLQRRLKGSPKEGLPSSSAN